ncbi:MAG TPA: hypothetical protein DEP87_02095 [Candidatus Pacebacteria bacterium]|nr:hypothetical protein [Candidatus Paceibacterota bacterium]
MPKKVFWPATLITMGLIFLAQNMGYFPAQFWNLWPLILIVVGLGGLLTSDREEWLCETTSRASAHRAKTSTKKSAAQPKRAKSRR